MMRVILPTPLWRLTDGDRQVELPVDPPATIAAVLDALEARYPVLQGTLRDQVSKERRPFIRFFVLGEDWSLQPLDLPLPDAITRGVEPLRIIGAMAGG